MNSKAIIRFLRYTSHGVAIASIGTLGVTPSWGGLILGISAFFSAFAFLAYEKGN